MQALVAWVEFPYRVRRRPDDKPETLSALATVGHDLQERLACHHAWMGTEHPTLARTYGQTLSIITEAVGPAVSEAWNRPPITNAAGMNLGKWGPAGAATGPIADLQSAIENRYGVRRLRAILIPHHGSQPVGRVASRCSAAGTDLPSTGPIQ